jgi:TPR repeat protein
VVTNLLRFGVLAVLLSAAPWTIAETSKEEASVLKKIEVNLSQSSQAYDQALMVLGQPTPSAQDLAATLERAAMHGHPIAAMMLARMNEEGRGIPVNRDKALYWYWSSIGFSFIHAGSTLDSLFDSKAPTITEKHAAWHRGLAERALAIEGLTLSTRTSPGLPTPGKQDEGQLRMRETLRAGQAAQTLTGSPAWRIEAVRPQLEQAPLLKDTDEKPNRERRKALDALAAEGNVNAIYELGMRQLHSKGLFANPEKGRKLLEQISEKSEHARIELGISELERKGGNPERAFNYLKASRTNPVAPYILGLQFQVGLGIDPNFKLASALFDEAMMTALTLPQLLFNSESARPVEVNDLQFNAVKAAVQETFNLLIAAGSPPSGAVRGGKYGPLDQELELANRGLERIPAQTNP